MTKQDNKKVWHHKKVTACIAELKTALTGLTQKEAEARQKVYGLNCLPTPKKRHLWVRFFIQFNHLLIYVLLGAALITSLLGHLVDTGVILAVVIVNALIGFIQEGKAEKALDAIRDRLAPRATVFRNGTRLTMSAQVLVPGDVVFLEAGDKVPADLRLVEAHGLMLQESILTGESVPVEKGTAAVSLDAVLGDRSCMVFSGTLVTHGQGRGIVVATGSDSEIGHISALLSRVRTLTTPLLIQMSKFARWITLLILLMAFLLFSYGYFVQHYAFTELFMIVVALSVAAIPEGLPAVLTITLAIGVQVMARHKAIVRRLPLIETLGSISVICTDKTGTLTKNEMMVVSIVTHAHQFTVEGVDYAPEGKLRLHGKIVCLQDYPILEDIARTTRLCNDAELYKRGDVWHVSGDPMEGALLSFAGKLNLTPQGARDAWTRTDTIPFDAKHRFMATLHHNHLNQAFVLVKGAPEKVLLHCQQQSTEPGQLEEMNQAYWEEATKSLAAEGQRVLALAMKPIPPEHTVLEFSDVESNLIFIGIIGLIDPPRPDALSALAQCERAGIEVKMLTGDHANTAAAIGSQIGIKHPDKVLTGSDLEQMEDLRLSDAVQKVNIFARITPEQKLKLVMALQSHGKIVAMTGDGVNDAPALKRADAGIAMGEKGSDVAKEAADLVLTDDNFTTIVSAVREGRTVYDNLKKVISWTLPTNAGETLILVTALFLGMTLPITAIQILWINLITAITLGLTLAFEPTEKDTMRRPPRPRSEPLLTGGLAWHTIFVSMLFVCVTLAIYTYAVGRGYSIDLARTMTLNTLVVLEIFHLFFIRNIYGTSLTWEAVKGTKVVWLSVSIITMAQFSITYLPFLQPIFGTEAVPVIDGMIIVGMGGLFFAVIELEKQLRLILSNRAKA